MPCSPVPSPRRGKRTAPRWFKLLSRSRPFSNRSALCSFRRLLHSRLARLAARLFRLEDGLAHSLHGAPGGGARLVRAAIEDIPNALRLRLKFSPLGLDRLNPADQVVGHLLLAVDAADGGRAAVAVDRRYSFGRREQLVPREDWADLRAPRVGAADALRVRHHVANFGANFVGRIG